MLTHKVNSEAVCIKCFKSLDTAASTELGRGPKENDLSVCAYCGTISKYTENLSLSPMCKSELTELEKKDPEAYAQLKKVERMIKTFIDD